MLSRSSAPASHCEHMINLVNQLVSKNVIDVVDVHGYVSMSVSMSSLVDTVCEYVIASVTGSKGANCKNTSGFFDLFAGTSFQKGNSLNHQRYMSLAESSNAW